MLLLQNILYCLLFILMVKCLVRNDGMNCVYFYPKEYIEEADKRGLIDKDAVMKKGKQVMIPFCIILFVVLIAIIFVWNKVTDFKTAYLQSYLFLVVMNWFDGFVIDVLWVGHSKIWRIEGMEGVPYVKPWRAVVIKRSAAMMLYLLVAAAIGGIVVLIGKI